MVTYEDFKKIELKTAKILDVKNHPQADKLYLVDIDLGSEKRQVVAGIRKEYNASELIGKNIIVVANIEPARIRGIESNGMLLAASDNTTLALLTLDKDMPAGSPIQ